MAGANSDRPVLSGLTRNQQAPSGAAPLTAPGHNPASQCLNGARTGARTKKTRTKGPGKSNREVHI